MASTTKYGLSIKGIGTALPETVVTNDDMAKLVDTSDEWIYSRTGFKERRVVTKDETVNDLAIAAAKDALAYAGMKGEDIDLIIVACSTPDHIYPAASCTVQAAIGATNAFGFDLSMGCSALVYALNIATQFIENGTSKNVLLVAADTHSRYMDWYDRNISVLFGDGAGALVVTRNEEAGKTDIITSYMMLDGTRGFQLKLPVQRPNCPVAEPRTHIDPSTVIMNGREVFKFAVGEVPKMIAEALEQAGMKPSDVDYYVLHQANVRIMDAMIEKLQLKPEQMVVSLEKYGNTSAASIPLALKDGILSGQVQPGKTMVLCGFGAGLAMALTCIEWNAVDQRLSQQQLTDRAMAAQTR